MKVDINNTNVIEILRLGPEGKKLFEEEAQEGPRKRRKVAAESPVFCTIKSKLKMVTLTDRICYKLSEVALLAHEIFKRGLFFLRLYCLCRLATSQR